MKIVKALFQNYAGLIEGLGRETVEIDFTEFNETDINKILLLGRNGSGKSVIANALSPFAENFDNRDTVIVEGRNGRKEITYETKDGTLVRCVHLWTKSGKVKSFVYINDNEDPVDETAKGNVTNFKNVVKDYLGVDPDFMKIGKIGADINNFIDLKPAERKSYLSKFMPEVEEWAQMNKHASTRLTDIKREIRGLEIELDKLDDIDDLTDKYNKITSIIDNLQAEKEKLDFSRGEETNKLDNIKQQIQDVIVRIIDDINPLFPDININDIIIDSDNEIRDLQQYFTDSLTSVDLEINTITTKINVLQKYVDGTATDTLDNRINKFREEFTKAESSLDFLAQKYTSSLAERERITQELTETNNELVKISNSKEILDNLEIELVSAKATLVETEEKYKDTPTDALDDTITYHEVKQTSDDIRYLCNNIDEILNYFESNEILVDCVNSDFNSADIKQLAKYNKTKAKDLTETISKRQSRKKIAEAQVSYAKHMSVAKCRDPNCPHEKTIIEFLKSSEQLENFDSDIDKLKTKILHHESLDEAYSNAALGCAEVRQVYNQMRKSESLLVKINAWEYFTNFTNFSDLLRLPKDEINKILSVDYYFEALSAKREISNAQSIIDNLNSKIEKQKSSKEYYDFFTKKLIKLEESQADNDKTIDNITTKQAQTKTNYDKLKYVIEYCEKLSVALNLSSKYNQSLTIIDKWINNNSTLVSSLDTIHTSLTEITNVYDTLIDELNVNEKEQSAITVKINRREDFTTRLANLQDTVEKTQIVYNATHPTRGAPVNFIKSFLENIRNIVNSLLDTALDGDMHIDFELSDKEFKIPVIKASGAIIPDVLQCSLGQISLVKTILSLSLVKNLYINSNTAYNIITLDEIDGPLDHEKNRKRFTNIIEKLCHELGIEQVFIISHNDNFFASEMGLILLPGHCMPIEDETFISNKLIISNLE